MSCRLYLIPTLLGDGDFKRSIPEFNLELISEIKIFVVENEKSARKFIKTVLPKKVQSELQIHILNKHTDDNELSELSKLLEGSEPIGILSEAGLPAVADPGARLVRLAHKKNIPIIPLVGPSSILLALMASGMNGQQFSFHGYLPIDKNQRKQAIQKLETESRKNHCTQIFMETPYRNNQLIEDLIKYCQPSTLLCVAANITLSDEFIKTMCIREWAQKKADLHKKPAIFLLESY